MPAPTPTPIVKPFGYAAAGSFIQVPIPDTTVVAGRASFENGFPPVTFQEKVAGGIPPNGADFNGILYQVTSYLVAVQAGQTPKYNGTVSTALGGYQKGAVLAMADDTGLWISLVDANTADPDAGSANWAPLYRYDYTEKNSLTGGVVTLSFAEACAPVIVLAGALVANLQLVLPNLKQEWRIVNLTTGLFTTTVRTAAGVGVLVPQGGFANATPVYGNGVDIFYDAAPLSITASVTPTANSVAQRDNSGFLFANKFDDLTNMVNTFGARTLAASGYYTLPGGFKIQWGTFLANADGTTVVTYPVPFTVFARPVCSGGTSSGNVQDNWPAVMTVNLANFVVINRLGSLVSTQWIAVGV
jgi:hypothetical protein